MRLIISAADGSEGAERAVEVAAALAKSMDANLLIVNVSKEREFSHAELRQLDRLHVTEGDALEEVSQRIMKRATALAQDRGAVNIETMGGAGDAAKVLIEIADLRHADAIVVGRRGLGKLGGLLLGSVSQELASSAPCIVVIVP
jgi:nucleotide-binding universal stress UspA family protein